MDLQGTLAVDSAPGKGTRVMVDIPAGGSKRST
jgi:signal transduction histidine kinase